MLSPFEFGEMEELFHIPLDCDVIAMLALPCCCIILIMSFCGATEELVGGGGVSLLVPMISVPRESWTLLGEFVWRTSGLPETFIWSCWGWKSVRSRLSAGLLVGSSLTGDTCWLVAGLLCCCGFSTFFLLLLAAADCSFCFCCCDCCLHFARRFLNQT